MIQYIVYSAVFEHCGRLLLPTVRFGNILGGDVALVRKSNLGAKEQHVGLFLTQLSVKCSALPVLFLAWLPSSSQQGVHAGALHCSQMCPVFFLHACM